MVGCKFTCDVSRKSIIKRAEYLNGWRIFPLSIRDSQLEARRYTVRIRTKVW